MDLVSFLRLTSKTLVDNFDHPAPNRVYKEIPRIQGQKTFFQTNVLFKNELENLTPVSKVAFLYGQHVIFDTLDHILNFLCSINEFRLYFYAPAIFLGAELTQKLDRVDPKPQLNILVETCFFTVFIFNIFSYFSHKCFGNSCKS